MYCLVVGFIIIIRFYFFDIYGNICCKVVLIWCLIWFLIIVFLFIFLLIEIFMWVGLLGYNWFECLINWGCCIWCRVFKFRWEVFLWIFFWYIVLKFLWWWSLFLFGNMVRFFNIFLLIRIFCKFLIYC